MCALNRPIWLLWIQLAGNFMECIRQQIGFDMNHVRSIWI